MFDSIGALLADKQKLPVSTLNDSLMCDHLFDMIGLASNDHHKEELSLKLLTVSERNLHVAGIPQTLLIYFKHKLAAAHNNLGYLLKFKGDIPSAIRHYDLCLKFLEEVGNSDELCKSLTNQGNLYRSLHEHGKAKQLLERAAKLADSTGNHRMMANIFNNLGSVLSSEGDHDKAFDHFQKALQYAEETQDTRGKATILNNIGECWEDKGDLHKAIDLFHQSLRIHEELKNERGISKTLHSIAHLYNKQKNYARAMQYAKNSLRHSVELGYPEYIGQTAMLIKEICVSTGNYKMALENYELAVKMRDSVNNETSRKASIRSQLKYEYEKKAAADSVANSKESEVKNAELQRQAAELKAKKNQQYVLFGGLFLVLLFAVFMFNRFKVTQKQKAIIELQKAEVEEQKRLVEIKQEEILDSIHYAQRIQKAHLPSERMIARSLEKRGAKKR